jgi:transposase
MTSSSSAWLSRWRNEVLAYFDTGLTNAITEGFNLTAKLVKRRAFGLIVTPILG